MINKFNLNDIVAIKDGYCTEEDRKINPWKVNGISLKDGMVCYKLLSLSPTPSSIEILEYALEESDDSKEFRNILQISDVEIIFDSKTEFDNHCISNLIDHIREECIETIERVINEYVDVDDDDNSGNLTHLDIDGFTIEHVGKNIKLD